MTKATLCLTALSLMITGALFSSRASGAPDQPKIGSRQIPVLTVDGLKFRDLNRNGQLDPYEDWRLSPEVRSADLSARMSLAEKAGTMMHGTLFTPEFWNRGDYVIEKARAMLLERHVTTAISRLRFAEPADLAKQHNALQEIAEQGRLGVPLVISVDPRNHLEERSYHSSPGISLWPTFPGFGAIGDLDLVRRFGDIARREYRALGIHMTLSPMADLATEPRWGRINGTMGEDPVQVRDLVRAYIEGFQGSGEGLTRDGVISIVKHWAGYGAAVEQGLDGHFDYGRWSGFPGGAFEKHLIPYEGALEVKVSGVMPTYTILRDLVHEGHTMEAVGGAFNEYLLTDLLRGRFGFKGMILSDWSVTDDRGTPWGMETVTELERFVKGVHAGIDQFGGTENSHQLIDAVERGLIEEQQLDTAVQRILVDKFRIGLFENPYVSPANAEVVVTDPESHAIARSAQQRALVLLKNEKVVLPLQREPGKTEKSQRVYLIGFEVTAAQSKGFMVVTDAAEADLAIVRLQPPQDNEGGSMPEGSLAFAPGQKEFDTVVALAASGLPVVATVHLNRPAVMTALLPHVQALFGDFGITDSALLDVIVGEAQPEGRLPFELPSSMAAVKAQKSDLPHDSDNPLFPIRFGLRYSD